MWYIVGAIVVLLALALLAILVLRARRRPPLVSVVLLRSAKPALSKEQLVNAYRRAYDAEPRVEPLTLDEHSTGYLFIPHDGPPVAIISAGRPYMTPEEASDAAAKLEHPAARKAMTGHVGWYGVDAFGIPAGTKPDELALVHAYIGRLAAELIDDQTLLLYLPARERIGEVLPETVKLLRKGKIGEVFADDSLHAPIIHVDTSDAAIEKAKEEARRRLPECITAFEGGRTSMAMVKAQFDASVDGKTGNEYIWLMLKSVEADGVVGTLANPPLDPKIGRKGDTLKVSIDRIMDWAYIDEHKNPHGLIVEKILMAKR